MNVSLLNLTHTFNGKNPRRALQGISAEIASGQFVAVIGPSGCGKSTLLRLIANLIQPTSGEIRLGAMTPAQAVSERCVAWMAQSPALLPWRTVLSNVQLAARFRSPEQSEGLQPEEALRMVGLEDSLHAYPAMLSGGMQQRLALARTLLMGASLWLMDEPFAALDELTRERLTVELLELWQPLQPTVLWVTHNLPEALRLADRVLVLSGAPGGLLADHRVELPRPRRDTSAAFLSSLESLRLNLGGELMREVTA